MRQKPQRDPVTPETRQVVLYRDMREHAARDGRVARLRHEIPTRVGCAAAFLDPLKSGPCSGPLTLDHVKDQPMMGKRAPSDQQHLVTICLDHHVGNGWATSNRPLLRQYLRSIYGPDS